MSIWNFLVGLVKTKTLSSILADFEKKIVELEGHSAAKKAQGAKKLAEAMAAQAAADLAHAESDKAKAILGNLRTLIAS